VRFIRERVASVRNLWRAAVIKKACAHQRGTGCRAADKLSSLSARVVTARIGLGVFSSHHFQHRGEVRTMG